MCLTGQLFDVQLVDDIVGVRHVGSTVTGGASSGSTGGEAGAHATCAWVAGRCSAQRSRKWLSPPLLCRFWSAAATKGCRQATRGLRPQRRRAAGAASSSCASSSRLSAGATTRRCGSGLPVAQCALRQYGSWLVTRQSRFTLRANDGMGQATLHIHSIQQAFLLPSAQPAPTGKEM